MNQEIRSNQAVDVENLEKKFGDFPAVNKISFSVKKGEIFGFLGPNGAGKSTTIRMLCGILSPTSGTGHVAGFDIIKENELIKQHIGYMSQKFSLYEDLTVDENINFYSGIYQIPDLKKKERKEWVIKMAGLENFRFSQTQILSGGWKQRLALGCSIIHEPEILFLDEPTSGVDPISRQHFWTLIKEMAKQKTTIFVTTHYMDEAENCDRIGLIYKGNIIALGSPEELKTEIMKEKVIKITLPNSEDWINKLLTVKGVKEVALFGVNIHVIVDNDEAVIPQINQLISDSGILDYEIKKITPSLEDVFVSLIEAYDKSQSLF